MNRRAVVLFSAIVGLLALSGCQSGVQSVKGFKPGDTRVDDAGQTWRLAEHVNDDGHTFLLYEWEPVNGS